MSGDCLSDPPFDYANAKKSTTCKVVLPRSDASVQSSGRGGIVNAYIFELPMETVETIAAIEHRIIELKQEHRDLDLAIDALVSTPVHDELQLKRLKKRKLLLKDQVSFLEAQLSPDVPA